MELGKLLPQRMNMAGTANDWTDDRDMPRKYSPNNEHECMVRSHEIRIVRTLGIRCSAFAKRGKMYDALASLNVTKTDLSCEGVSKDIGYG